MFGSVILDVVIGLIFIYILLAIFTSTVIEIITSSLSWRSKTLFDGIKTLLSDDGLADRLYKHPLINNLAKGDRKPSYIPARNFAVALIDFVREAEETLEENKEAIHKSIRDLINQISDPDLRRTAEEKFEFSQAELERLKENLETWFDGAMDRVSGWYSRKAQWVGLAIAVLVTIAFNADTLAISNELFTDANLRVTLAEAAEIVNQDPTKTDSLTNIPLPLGWSIDKLPANGEWVGKIVGLIITAVAVSLGAPFWFQTLNRIVGLRQGIRRSGPPPPTGADAGTARSSWAGRGLILATAPTEAPASQPATESDPS